MNKKRFFTVFIFIAVSCFASAENPLLIGTDDLRLVAEFDSSLNRMSGYHLYIRKRAGLESVMITESSKDPAGKNDSYALRAYEKNRINGEEIRIYNGKKLDSKYSLYSLIDSTAEPFAHFGEAFHIYIPVKVRYGYPWSRNGEIEVSSGTLLNLRAFSKKYADYSGGFYDNPFVLDLSSIAYMEKNSVSDSETIPSDDFFSDGNDVFVKDGTPRDVAEDTQNTANTETAEPRTAEQEDEKSGGEEQRKAESSGAKPGLHENPSADSGAYESVFEASSESGAAFDEKKASVLENHSPGNTEKSYGETVKDARLEEDERSVSELPGVSGDVFENVSDGVEEAVKNTVDADFSETSVDGAENPDGNPNGKSDGKNDEESGEKSDGENDGEFEPLLSEEEMLSRAAEAEKQEFLRNFDPKAEERFAEISGNMAYSKGPSELVREIVELLNADRVSQKSYDLVFVIDATGSMKDDIEQLRISLPGQLMRFRNKFDSFRVGLVFYRDYESDFSYYGLPIKFYNFTDNLDRFSDNLNDIALVDAVDEDVPEAVYEGLYGGLALYTWNREAFKKIILIGDAEPHPKPRATRRYTKQLVERLSSDKGVRMDSVLLQDGRRAEREAAIEEARLEAERARIEAEAARIEAEKARVEEEAAAELPSEEPEKTSEDSSEKQAEDSEGVLL